MNRNFVYQENKSLAIHPKTRLLIVFLVTEILCSCAAHKKPDYIEVPTKPFLDSFKGEQGSVLRRYGLPDRAFHGPLETTQWIYCSDPQSILIIEFDTQGMILSQYVGDDGRFCPATGPKEPNNLPPQRNNESEYQDIDTAPQYRPYHLIRHLFPCPLTAETLHRRQPVVGIPPI